MRAPALLTALAVTVVIAAPAPAAAQARDWTRTVVLTPEGGFRMGNPNAKVKVVEYASMTCPHCAQFAASAKAPLMQRVRGGKVSFELRNFVLNGIDVTATLLTRCAGPAQFFAMTDRLFATQPQWVGRISGMSADQKAKVQALPEDQRLARLAETGGLTAIAAQHGVPAARARQCLADAAALERLGTIRDGGSKLGVEGTPTFFVNGKMVHAHEWQELEPAIRQAGG